jgi:hypothetical protein
LAERVLVTGGAGFLGSHLCEWLVRRGHDVLCVDNFYTGNKMNLRALRGNPDFEIMRHDITFPLYVEVDQIFNLACPAAPIYYQFDPVQTTKTSRAWRDQHAGAGQAAEGEDPASLDQRRVWRPYGSSAAREPPWQRQPARSARLLRRGQKVRRDPVLRLSSTARRADPGRPDLQHLRAPDAAERRPRRLQLHRPGAPGASRSRSMATAARRGPSASSTP